MRVRVKICGITSVEDARVAADLGADAVGIILAPESPRYVPAALAAEIFRMLPPFVHRVGVFVNEPPERMASLAREVGLDLLQFHGEEEPETCARASLPWYKAFRVGEGFDLARLDEYGSGVHLLDASSEGRRGGTGKTVDWAVAAEAARRHRIILSGGLGPDNVVAAVEAARPHAVDINSGVESSPGVKVRAELTRLFRALEIAGYR